MKILFVAMGESIHSARWISQISDENWEISLFPSTTSNLIQPELKKYTYVYEPYLRQKIKKQKSIIGSSLIKRSIGEIKNFIYRLIDFLIIRKLAAAKLIHIIQETKPDIVHSLEFQHAGYLVSKVKRKFKGRFPTWIATNWGSDIYYFGRRPEHRAKIQEILEQCDYYSCECDRDVCLAKTFGFDGKTLPVIPNTGGFNLKKLKSWRKTKPSNRKIIMLKGYGGLFGRVSVGLKALVYCKDILKGYKIVVYSASSSRSFLAQVEKVEKSIGVSIKVLPSDLTHDQILKYHGKARISIGLSISDGISTSFLETLVMGSFPIQSDTSCANEWAKNGKTAFIVPPENSEAIAEAIRKALTGDKLVDKAAEINWQVAKKRLDEKLLKQKIVKTYQEIFKEKNRFKQDKRRFTSFNILAEIFLICWVVFIMGVWLVKGIADSGLAAKLPPKTYQKALKADQWIDRNVWRDY